MDQQRRRVLTVGGGLTAYRVGAYAVGLGTAWMPHSARSAELWNQAAFAANTLEDVILALGGPGGATESSEIHLDAPEIAENGAVVPITVESALPNTISIALVIPKNPNALSANFMIPDGTDAYVSTRIKMAESSDVYALVKSGDRYFYSRKLVKVTVGGCGG